MKNTTPHVIKNESHIRKEVLIKYKDCPDREYVNSLFAKLDKSKHFNDEWSERSNPYNNLNWRKDIIGISKTIDMLDLIDSNLKIVDAGAGTGKISLAIAEYADQKNMDVNIFAIDQSYAMLEKCPEHKKIKKYVADVEYMSFIPDDSVDRIICSMVLHSEFEQAENIIKEFRRILKKGGILVIFESIPMDDSLIDFYMSFLTIKEKRVMFTKDDLFNMLNRNDFEDVIIEDMILEEQSIKNWLNNSCTEYNLANKIIKIHQDASDDIKRKISMVERDNDIFCSWKFAFVKGVKKSLVGDATI